MANEVRIYEMQERRAGAPLRTVPFVAKQTISLDGSASAAFNRSTTMITVTTTAACWVQIAATPTLGQFKLEADTPYDFSVLAGHKIIAKTAES